ncbi:flagellar basal body protein FliL [Spirochaetia bacterium]|nr:flagellar basal body protein FliL [Spirochaetia bacterium]
MSDSEELDLGDGDAGGGESSAPKKASGLGALLPNLLKFVAIGIGALIFIVTVAAITFNIMNKGGKSQTAVTDPTSAYVGKRPEYAWYTNIGPVTTRTRDEAVYSVTIDMIIGYDLNNAAATTEFGTRQYELRDFVRSYFRGKYAAELENEDRLKQEIKEILNTRYLDIAKARNIVFNKFDVMEMP